jgi:hypothetical protein
MKRIVQILITVFTVILLASVLSACGAPRCMVEGCNGKRDTSFGVTSAFCRQHQ